VILFLVSAEVENSKSEARNPKQNKMNEIRMIKTQVAKFLFWTSKHCFF